MGLNQARNMRVCGPVKRNLGGEMGIESKSDSRSVFERKSGRRNFGTKPPKPEGVGPQKSSPGLCRTVFPRCEPEFQSEILEARDLLSKIRKYSVVAQFSII